MGESARIKQDGKTALKNACENPNMFKLQLSVLHNALLVAMWFICQMDFILVGGGGAGAEKWRCWI